MRRMVAFTVVQRPRGRGLLVLPGDEDRRAGVDDRRIVGTISGGVISRGGGGTLSQVSGAAAVVMSPSMQVIDVNGDGKDDLVLPIAGTALMRDQR